MFFPEAAIVRDVSLSATCTKGDIGVNSNTTVRVVRILRWGR